MVNVHRQMGDVVLFYAGESLMGQVAGWVRKHSDLFLRLVASVGAPAINAALAGASAVIIDATEHPGRAMDALQHAIGRVEREKCEKLAVYTERTHDGLEIFVRVRRAPLLLGPLDQSEWEAFFKPMLRWQPGRFRPVGSDLTAVPMRLVTASVNNRPEEEN